jgi:hypothetical protein
MKQFQVTYTCDGVKKQETTAQPQSVVNNLFVMAITAGVAIASLTIKTL